MSQGVPPNVDTLVQWCCDEITSAGVSSVTGVNANGTIATAGTYLARASVIVGLDNEHRISPTIMLLTDDSGTDLNTADGLPLAWSAEAMNGVDGWLWVVSDPTKITAQFNGEARITFAIEAITASMAPTADEVDIYIAKNGGADDPLLGEAALKFNYNSGLAHGQIVTFDPTVSFGDYYEIWGQAEAPIVGPVTVFPGGTAPHTFWTAERTTVPTITASLKLYDPSDTFVDTIDSQTVQAFGYSFSLGGVFSAQSGFKVKTTVTHNDDAGPKTVDDDSHMDIVKTGGYLAWETC